MSRAIRAAAVAVLAAAAVLAVAGPAAAHDVLVSSTPAAGETVTTLPERFGVTMNEPPLDLSGTGEGFAIAIQDADGRYYGDGCLQIVDTTMSTTAELGAPGAYTMTWQLISSDGHPTSGEVPFTWAPAAASGVPVAEGQDALPRCGATAPAAPDSGGGHGGTAPPAELPLADVLWIGGAVLVVGVALTIAIVVATRKPRN